MEVDRNGLQVLDRSECLELLRSVPVGRIGVTSGALPTILPVNFLLDGDRVLIRTGRGSKLDAATRNAVVAFEADDVDAFARVGWSVVVTGVARDASATPSGGRGLRNMRERAEHLGGTLTVEPSPTGQGTRLCWRAPTS